MVSTRAREIAVIGFVAGMALGLFIGTNADPQPHGRAAAPALASSPSPSTDGQTPAETPASTPDPVSNLLSGLVGALIGGGLAYIGALHIQRRDFDKNGRDAARAVFYELILNRSTVSLSRATGMLMPPAMSRATYDQALLVLSGALPADEMNPIVLAYVDVSMTLAQYQTGETLSADAAAKFEVAEKDMTVAIDILAKYFTDDEKSRLMGEIRAQQSGLRQPGQITLEIMERLRAEGPKSYVDDNVERVVSATDHELQVGEADNPTRLRAFVDEGGTVTVRDHAAVAEVGTLFRSLASELALAGASGYTPTIAVAPSVPASDETVGRVGRMET